MMETYDALATEWIDFADETFGVQPARRMGVMNHLVEEVNELAAEVKVSGKPMSDKAMEEAADVFVLLMHLTSDDVVRFKEAIRAKMEKNYRRVWNKPGADGVVKHVKGIED